MVEQALSQFLFHSAARAAVEDTDRAAQRARVDGRAAGVFAEQAIDISADEIGRAHDSGVRFLLVTQRRSGYAGAT